MEHHGPCTPLADPIIHPLAIMDLFQAIPASIRRRLPRVSPSLSLHRFATTADLHPSDSHPPAQWPGLRSASEPDLQFYGCGTETVLASGADVLRFPQRPATAQSVATTDPDRDSSDSGGEGKSVDTATTTTFPDAVNGNGNGSYGADTMGPLMAAYEAQSGVRWNRVVPALSLLRNAGYEAQQPHCDDRLIRSLYIHALSYLLNALPSDLTREETAAIRNNLPHGVKTSLLASHTSPPGYSNRPHGTAHPAHAHSQRSYLHRLLAACIIQFCILVQFLLPYVKICLRHVYQYERSHRVTERFVSATLDAADSLGKGSVRLMNINEGRVGAAVSGLAAWWVEGIAGGIYEGVGEGMTILGFVRSRAEVGGKMQMPSR